MRLRDGYSLLEEIDDEYVRIYNNSRLEDNPQNKLSSKAKAIISNIVVGENRESVYQKREALRAQLILGMGNPFCLSLCLFYNVPRFSNTFYFFRFYRCFIFI